MGGSNSNCAKSFKNKLDVDGATFVPLPYCTEGCVLCGKFDTGVTLMTSESRGVVTRQLQVLAEDIRRMEARLAEDKPLFVHQDCLKTSTLSLASAIHGVASNR